MWVPLWPPVEWTSKVLTPSVSLPFSLVERHFLLTYPLRGVLGSTLLHPSDTWFFPVPVIPCLPAVSWLQSRGMVPAFLGTPANLTIQWAAITSSPMRSESQTWGRGPLRSLFLSWVLSLSPRVFFKVVCTRLYLIPLDYDWYWK